MKCVLAAVICAILATAWGAWKRVSAIFLCLLLAASSASAGPLEWPKHHKRFVLMEGAAIGAALIHAAGLHHCRKANGVEPCDEHYGAAWAMFGVTTGITVIALPAVAEGCWKHDQGKFCYLFAYSGSTAQTAWGIHEWTIKPEQVRH